MRLRRSDSAGPGYRRVASGRGFGYRDAAGATVRDAELRARFDALAIPPAWTEVWIAPFPNGHIQATGIDGAGRRQYIYHPTWREQKDRIKHDRALALAETLPAARRQVTIDLRREDEVGVSRERALAAAFRMLDTGSLRVGSEQYASSHGSFGLSTLLGAHVAVRGGDTVELRFPAKSGQEWESDILDADLAAVVARLKRRGGRARLLAWRDDRGWHPLAAAEINEDVRARTGGDFTAKDFRTLHGTVAAAVSLAKHGPERTPTARKRAIARAMRDASAVLSNTPAIARASYVDPRILDLYADGVTIDPARLSSAESELRALLFS
ncbi:DNA topoisomerase IB [Schumannella luteola]|uniref:DNA topoisomerase n=1 Tax=Schumannella luteola TaxID=472059 RepID=A0A852YNB6_9MICO|nr:DNA topoisomerase IB [Schumannella luteola]NYH00659.1 DNA topoisomerase-1 [Schumannella luteola]TPX05675.1 DNA topoisomerase IB [Schumannella luteola]